MKHACMVTRVPYERRGVPTETPEARAEITAAVRAWQVAEADLKARRDERDEALRKHYSAGVDPRDLTAIAHEADWPAHIVHIKRIVRGARTTD